MNREIEVKMMGNTTYFGGIDVGSTTVKLVIMDEDNQTVFSRYERHYSDVKAASEKKLSVRPSMNLVAILS